MKRILFIFIVLAFLGTVNILAQTQIWDEAGLNNIRNTNLTLSSDYIQMADITITSNWIPIGTDSARFTGTYNGNGFEIIGLNSTTGGLFGITNEATISNVSLNDISIHSTVGTVGGLVGHAINTKIENCSTGPFGVIEQFDIEAGGGDVGGLVGILEGTHLDGAEFISYIKNSYNQVTVKGNERVGGLVGSTLIWGEHPNLQPRYSLIYRCFNIGPVVDSQKVGGLVGMNAEGSTIEECWSANTVDAEEQVGGLVAVNYGYILNCFSICGRPVIGDYVGGLVGVNYSTGVVQNCYSSRVVQLAGEMQHPGGLIGWGAPGQTPPPPTEPTGYGEVINSYWCVDRSGVDSLGYSNNYDILYNSGKLGAARTQEEMAVLPYAPNTYVSWLADWYDNIDPYIWEATEADGPSLGYPVLFGVTFVWDCRLDNPLPVELSSFTATVIAAIAVNLQWRAETETNVLGYNVYRSEYNDMGDAIKINGPVIIAYNSSAPTNYSFLDEEVMPETTYYYWLESVDLDMTNAFHGPVSVMIAYDDDDDGSIPPIPLETKLIGAYPNPFNPGTHIAFSLEETARVTISIYNNRGQFIRTLTFEQEFTAGKDHSIYFDGKNHLGNEIKTGIYFYNMKTDNNYSEVKKMLLLK